MASDSSAVLTVSTEDMDERQRDALVRDFYGRICMRLELAPAEGTQLQMEARTNVLPQMTLTRANVAAMSWTRAQDLMSDGSDDLCISWMEGGYRFRDLRGQDVAIPRGAPCLMPMQEMWRAVAPEGGFTLCIQVSKAALAPLCRTLDDLPADAIRKDSVEARLLTSYMNAVTQETLEGATGMIVQQHVLDLLSVALNRGYAAQEKAPNGIRAARLHAIKQFVAASINEPGLSAETAARGVGLSPRYIRELFAEAGSSFMDYLTEQRLERVRRRLVNPADDYRAIADIAYEEGFSDPSTFYRRFKARYECAPSDFRRRESLLRRR
jgi:AraC-like DNA-binding protein